MRVRLSHIVIVAIVTAGAALLMCGAAFSPSSDTTLQNPSPSQALPIKIDYPLEGSVFPPEITPPTFLWHDANESSKRWVLEISFAGVSTPLRINAPGDLLQRGQSDPDAGPDLALTLEQATTHTWKPDIATWEKIKHLSVNSPARITIMGLAPNVTEPSSIGHVTISTSSDPVGAPVFYRDVPLRLPPPEEKGPIAPLPRSAIPLIKWQIRDISQPKSHLVMTNLPTCANCHSVSRDGTTFGLDLDGPRNDKGLYALVPISKDMTIRNSNVIHWSSFGLNEETRAADPAVKRFGFMSQVSPTGRYVVTSIGPPNNTNKHQNEEPGFASGILDRIYSTNYRSIQFSQVFYPTRGILAWYDSKEGKMRPLPGADDAQYVQTSAFWSPDGKYLIFSRALARDPYPVGAAKPEQANDPGETQIQYDLYKIPFNEGRGGKAVPVEGASANGMSNNFPKVSPDGKWIVFVQNKNGLLMRPDSKLYIVPFAGGKARLMHCNLAPMNSWHTWSPNGHWLAFSSKARGPYTRLMLTHIDADGNDTPAIIVDDTTAANRAINIPEFINLPAGTSIDKIDPEATNFYRLFDQAYAQIEASQFSEAIDTLHKAIATNPEDPLSHYILATALSANDQERDALIEYRKAVSLMPTNPTFLDHLAVSLALNGDSDGAIEQLNRAIAVDPGSVEYRFNVAYVLESRGDFDGAVAPLEKAVALSRGKDWRCLAELAKVYDKTGRTADAIPAVRQALDLAVKQNDQQAAATLQDALNHYQHFDSGRKPN
ncbi:tetratricopeptide repeat protein [Telmatobacter sp. DSM 110680]|uniref:Tetratricopeptide repeat protein n=1 Tax=Telmatobacter sp. DSM 110680 TaxID=3036704 RepID=A0AAU7DCA7_9BACT